MKTFIACVVILSGLMPVVIGIYTPWVSAVYDTGPILQNAPPIPPPPPPPPPSPPIPPPPPPPPPVR